MSDWLHTACPEPRLARANRTDVTVLVAFECTLGGKPACVRLGLSRPASYLHPLRWEQPDCGAEERPGDTQLVPRWRSLLATCRSPLRLLGRPYLGSVLEGTQSTCVIRRIHVWPVRKLNPTLLPGAERRGASPPLLKTGFDDFRGEPSLLIGNEGGPVHADPPGPGCVSLRRRTSPVGTSDSCSLQPQVFFWATFTLEITSK